MKYLALSSPSPPPLFSSSNFLREKKSGGKKKTSERWQRAYSMFSWYDYLDAPFSGWMGEEAATWIGGGQDRKISPQGEGMTHAEVEHGIWFMLLGRGEENGLGRRLVCVGSKRACSGLVMVRHCEAFSMHKWTNIHRQARTVHACIHDRMRNARTQSFFFFCFFFSRGHLYEAAHLRTGWPWQ